MAGLRVDFALLLEPLGFIKVLEWIFSIFAFATCGGFQGETRLLVSCEGVANKTVTAAFAYPFRLNTVAFSAPDPKRCGGTWTDVYLVGNFSSSAQFFVTLAVLVFLYCIAALVVYIGYKHVYQQNSKLPLSDLAITVITAFLWLVSTSAWAKALADIKISTGPSIISGIEFCKAPGTTCHFASVSSMRTLNVSVVFGLLNMALWAGNIWFVYKDTNLHNNPTGFLKVQEYNQLKEECKNKVIF
ncbi:synaptophysin-like protein 1 isoform X1 [Cuculus canorus]|uniref:synaptophysin-like protein 1 isoform X1 n=1 Tax=Cuculus canorus TaxID=55661 RepID=UPI0023AA5D7E|nr:synaptophysin-like protein 1 isoform X1 [Cuculus canorus]XP_053912155.1 synaptophysin-like protein 1 isoform X1 [Cuculus canorus]